MTSNITHAKSITYLLLFILFILGIAYAYAAHIGDELYTHKDYGKFYQAANFALEGKSPYTKIFIVKNAVTSTGVKQVIKPLSAMLNPPFFVLLVLPLALMSYTLSLWLWTMISIACGVIGIIFAYKALDLNIDNLNFKLSLIVAFFSYYPTFSNIQFGQVTFILMPLITGAWLATRNNKQLTAAILLAVAASIKPFFGMFLVYFLLRREWLGFLVFVMGNILFAFLAWLAFGTRAYIDYFYVAHHVTWFGTNWNISIWGFLLRLFGGEHNASLIFAPWLAGKVFWVLAVTLLMSLVWFIWPKKAISIKQKSDLDFSIILLSSFLLSPLAWLYYAPMLLVVFLVLLKYAEKVNLNALRLLTCLYIVATSYPYKMLMPSNINHVNVISVFLQGAQYFAAVLLLLGLLYWMRYVLSKASLPLAQEAPDSLNRAIIYTVTFIPSLLSILGIINSASLFGYTFAPNFSSVFLGT